MSAVQRVYSVAPINNSSATRSTPARPPNAMTDRPLGTQEETITDYNNLTKYNSPYETSNHDDETSDVSGRSRPISWMKTDRSHVTLEASGIGDSTPWINSEQDSRLIASSDEGKSSPSINRDENVSLEAIGIRDSKLKMIQDQNTVFQASDINGSDVRTQKITLEVSGISVSKPGMMQDQNTVIQATDITGSDVRTYTTEHTILKGENGYVDISIQANDRSSSGTDFSKSTKVHNRPQQATKMTNSRQTMEVTSSLFITGKVFNVVQHRENTSMSHISSNTDTADYRTLSGQKHYIIKSDTVPAKMFAKSVSPGEIKTHSDRVLAKNLQEEIKSYATHSETQAASSQEEIKMDVAYFNTLTSVSHEEITNDIREEKKFVSQEQQHIASDVMHSNTSAYLQLYTTKNDIAVDRIFANRSLNDIKRKVTYNNVLASQEHEDIELDTVFTSDFPSQDDGKIIIPEVDKKVAFHSDFRKQDGEKISIEEVDEKVTFWSDHFVNVRRTATPEMNNSLSVFSRTAPERKICSAVIRVGTGNIRLRFPGKTVRVRRHRRKVSDENKRLSIELLATVIKNASRSAKNMGKKHFVKDEYAAGNSNNFLSDYMTIPKKPGTVIDEVYRTTSHPYYAVNNMSMDLTIAAKTFLRPTTRLTTDTINVDTRATIGLLTVTNRATDTRTHFKVINRTATLAHFNVRNGAILAPYNLTNRATRAPPSLTTRPSRTPSNGITRATLAPVNAATQEARSLSNISTAIIQNKYRTKAGAPSAPTSTAHLALQILPPAQPEIGVLRRQNHR